MTLILRHNPLRPRILPPGPLDQLDKLAIPPPQPSLEQLHQIPNHNTFSGNRSLDLVERRERLRALRATPTYWRRGAGPRDGRLIAAR